MKEKIKIIKPVVDSIVFAVNSLNEPEIWCNGINWDGEKYNEFVITKKDNNPSEDTLFMSKSDGCFNDDNIETFESWEDAREKFEEFYK